MSISEFQVEPEIEKVLTDMPLDAYPSPHDVGEEAASHIPLNYYDNDDGFWDKYIDHKTTKWAQNDMIVNRKFFKH